MDLNRAMRPFAADACLRFVVVSAVVVFSVGIRAESLRGADDDLRGAAGESGPESFDGFVVRMDRRLQRVWVRSQESGSKRTREFTFNLKTQFTAGSRTLTSKSLVQGYPVRIFERVVEPGRRRSRSRPMADRIEIVCEEWVGVIDGVSSARERLRVTVMTSSGPEKAQRARVRDVETGEPLIAPRPRRERLQITEWTRLVGEDGEVLLGEIKKGEAFRADVVPAKDGPIALRVLVGESLVVLMDEPQEPEDSPTETQEVNSREASK